MKGGGGITDDDYEAISFSHSDYIVSFLCPWILPKEILNLARIAAINFHPGSPNYPGIGCYNFALYEQAKEYGVTCHHMNEKVDTGNIIMTSKFPISLNESVESLKLKSMIHMTYIFEKIVHIICDNKPLPESDEKWQRPAFTRKQLEDLCYVDNTMSEREINLRIHATDYPLAGRSVFTMIGNKKFYYKTSKNISIV